MEIREVRSEQDYETLRSMIEEYSESVGVSVCFQKLGDELAELPKRYGAPWGRAYLVFVDGKLAGCGGVQWFAENTCEMRRMYVRPTFRGLHLGRKLAEQIILAGRELGYQKMVLDSLPDMRVAQNLYRSLGFRETAAYKGSAVEHTLFMELELTEQ